MVDVSAIAGTVSALKGAVDITKAMIGLHDAQAIQAKVIELNAKILDAQSSAFAANDERSALIERVGKLEAELARTKTWDTEKNRYQMRDFGGNTIAYELKREETRGEPPHRLCAACYQQGKKGFLNTIGRNAYQQEMVKCSECDKEFLLGQRVERNFSGSRARSDFDPFTGR